MLGQLLTPGNIFSLLSFKASEILSGLYSIKTRAVRDGNAWLSSAISRQEMKLKASYLIFPTLDSTISRQKTKHKANCSISKTSYIIFYIGQKELTLIFLTICFQRNLKMSYLDQICNSIEIRPILKDHKSILEK